MLLSLLRSRKKMPGCLENLPNKIHNEIVNIRQRKREDRFLELLESHFNRSDHCKLDWDEAKKYIQGKSAYEDLSRNDRKKVFNEHMSNLRYILLLWLIF